jgi:hypothetical protein
VVRIGRSLYLARRTDAGAWQRVAQKTVILEDLQVTGHVMGIVWANLSGR